MGVLAPGSAHARPSAQPPMNMSGIYLVHMSAYIPENYDPKFNLPQTFVYLKMFFTNNLFSPKNFFYQTTFFTKNLNYYKSEKFKF